MVRVLEAGTIVRVQSWDVNSRIPVGLERTLELKWPQIVGTVASGRAEVVCIGPADWLVLSLEPDHAVLTRTFEAAFAATNFRATTISSSLKRVRIDEPYARDLLSKGCGLDLHDSVFGVGQSARARLAGMPVIVRRVEPDAIELIVSSSYHEYLLAWLADAASEYSATL